MVFGLHFFKILVSEASSCAGGRVPVTEYFPMGGKYDKETLSLDGDMQSSYRSCSGFRRREMFCPRVDPHALKVSRSFLSILLAAIG